MVVRTLRLIVTVRLGWMGLRVLVLVPMAWAQEDVPDSMSRNAALQVGQGRRLAQTYAWGVAFAQVSAARTGTSGAGSTVGVVKPAPLTARVSWPSKSVPRRAEMEPA